MEQKNDIEQNLIRLWILLGGNLEITRLGAKRLSNLVSRGKRLGKTLTQKLICIVQKGSMFFRQHSLSSDCLLAKLIVEQKFCTYLSLIMIIKSTFFMYNNRAHAQLVVDQSYLQQSPYLGDWQGSFFNLLLRQQRKKLILIMTNL